MLNRETLPMRCLEIVALLDDGVAEALEISRRVHHVHECALDLACETLVVHGLTTQRAVAPLGDSRVEQAFGLTHQRRAREEPRLRR